MSGTYTHSYTKISFRRALNQCVFTTTSRIGPRDVPTENAVVNSEDDASLAAVNLTFCSSL